MSRFFVTWALGVLLALLSAVPLVLYMSLPPSKPVAPTAAELECAFVRGRLAELERRIDAQKDRQESLTSYVEFVETLRAKQAGVGGPKEK